MSTSNKSAAEEELAVRPTMLERRPLRPFKSSEEYLYAMKEDLADWLTTLYELDIGADTFLEALETGVVLCRHANNVRRMALEYSGRMTYPIPDREVTYRADVVPGTFQARDNVSNFIWWCRALGIYECLLFETDDLVLRKNEKSFILCLLEVARRGSKVGMLAPLLVQMEEEIDREIAAEENARIRAETSMTEETTEAITPEVIDVPWQPPVQIITNDLKNLDEMVRDLVNRCTCPFQFPMIRVSEGKYRIGDTKLLIYVRILRSHVMVRVGGGWDTLAHFLDKHDPCRCRQGHRAPLSSKLTVKFGGVNCPAQTQMEVTYQRSSVPISPSAHCSPFVPPRQRSVSPMPTSMQPASPTRQRRNSTSSSSSSSHKLSNGSLASLPGDRSSSSSTSSGTAVAVSAPSTTGTPSVNQTTSANGGAITTCDSSSEYSDDGYKSGSRIPTIHAIKKYSPKKLLKLTENGGGGIDVEGTSENGESDENPDISPRDSLLGEEEDDDDVDAASSPLPDNHPDVVPANSATSRKAQQDVQSRKPGTVADEKSRRCSIGQTSSNRARRLSGDVIPALCHQHQTVRRMPRSRSQSSEVSDGSAMARGGGGFARNQTGRYSYRNPQLLSEQQRYRSGCAATTPDKNNTWSFRSRSSRPSMGVDLFLGGDDSRSPSTSPQRRQRNVNVNGSGPRSLQASPSKHYAPLLQQMLADVALDSDDKVLRRMATILRQRKMSAPSPCPIAVPDDDTGTATPDSESELGLEPVTRLLKVSPRKDNYPQSGSKIPLPTFY